MQLEITTRHGEISEAAQQKIQSKTEKLLKYLDKINAILVVVDLENKDNIKLELKVSADRYDDFLAKTTGGEIFAALDLAISKVEQQIRKQKDKKIERHRKQ